MRGPWGMSKNTGYITVLNVDGHKHTRRAGFHNPCGFVTDIYYTTNQDVLHFN